MDKATVAMARAHHTVSFTDPEGLAQTITVQDPKMRDFIKTLKVGDEVAITYTEALAITRRAGQLVTGAAEDRQDQRRAESDHGRCRRQPDRRRAALGGPRRVGVRATQFPFQGRLDFARRLLP